MKEILPSLREEKTYVVIYINQIQRIVELLENNWINDYKIEADWYVFSNYLDLKKLKDKIDYLEYFI